MITQSNPTFIDKTNLEAEFLLNGDASDTSGNGNDGTATSITWLNNASGKLYTKQYASFNGSSSKINFGDILDMTTSVDLSFSFWVKFNSVASYSNIITKYSTTGSANRNYSLGLNNAGELRFLVYDSAGATDSLNSSFSPTTDVWYHIVITWDGSTKGRQIYVNGVLDESDTSTKTPVNTTADFKLGQVDGGSAYYHNGDIAFVRAYSKVLAPQEIKTLYQEGLRQFGPTNLGQYGLLFEDCVFYSDGQKGFVNLIDGVAPTISGATQTTDHLGNSNHAYDFSSDYIRTSLTSSNGDTVSFAGWVRSDNISTAVQSVVSNYDRNAIKGSACRIDSSKIAVYAVSSGGATYSRTSGTLLSNTWYFVVIQWHGDGETSLYIDGVAQTTTAGTKPSTSQFSTRDWVLGAQAYYGSYGSERYLDGQISTGLFFSNTLSADQVTQLTNLLNTKYIYPFSEYSLPNLIENLVLEISKPAVSTTLYDSSGSGNNGTVTDIDDYQLGLHTIMPFNGSTSKINFGNVGNVKSISFRIKLTTTTENIFEESSGTGVSVSGGTLSYGSWDNAYIDGEDTNTIDTEWRNVVITSSTDVSLSALQFGLITSTYGDFELSDIQVSTDELSQENAQQLYYSNYIN